MIRNKNIYILFYVFCAINHEASFESCPFGPWLGNVLMVVSDEWERKHAGGKSMYMSETKGSHAGVKKRHEKTDSSMSNVTGDERRSQ